MLAQATSSIRNENESLHNLQGKTKAQKQRMKPFVSIWKIRRISLWMKFSICLRTDIWDGWVLSGHQLAAPSPHFWSFDPRFSRKTESHPYLLEGKFRKRKSPIMVGIALVREFVEKKLLRNERSAKWRSAAPTATTIGTGELFFNLDNIKAKELACSKPPQSFVLLWNVET